MTNHVEYRICKSCGGAIVLSGNSGIVPFKYCVHQIQATSERFKEALEKINNPFGVKGKE